MLKMLNLNIKNIFSSLYSLIKNKTESLLYIIIKYYLNMLLNIFKSKKKTI